MEEYRAMELKSCILSRMSSRVFNPKMIPNDIILEILNAARYAPSPKNRQPWRFLILRGNEKDDIIDNHQKNFKSCSDEIEYLMKNEIDSVTDSFNIIKQAPILVLVFNSLPSQKVLSSYNIEFDLMNVQAIGAAIENILLRATDLGIGSLWLGDILSEEEFISKKYPNAGKLIAGISLGYTEFINKSTNRLSLSEIIVNYKKGDKFETL